MHEFRRRGLRVALASILLLWVAAGWGQATKAAKSPRDDLTIDPQTIMQPWTGDLDQMVERRIVRVLVVPSKTFYFNDKGRQRGATYDTFQLVEKELEKELARDKKSRRKHLKVQFFYIPVAREEIFSALVAGKGDIAAANLSITERREALVDFTTPHTTDVRELVVTGPGTPAVSTLDDLAGKEVFVRRSSAYYERLVELNDRFAAENKPLVKLKEAPDALEDEDLIEMLNAGLVPLLVVDKHIADFWKKVFPKITVHDAIAVHSGGKIVFINDAGLRMLGAAHASDVVGKSVLDFVHAESRVIVRQRMQAMLQRGETVPLISEKFLRADGTPFDVEVAATPVRYHDQPAVQVWVRDITDRRRAEAALRASEARLSQAQAIAHLGVWELDLSNLDDVNANALWWSDETYRIFGYVPGRVAISNELFFHAVPEADRPKIQAAVAQSIRDGTPYHVEHRIIRPDGAERIVREQSSIVHDSTGRPVRMTGTVLDVTEQRRLEEQLRQAQKMEAVGQLAGGLAHDFNNLLTTILTMCQMLQSDLPSDATVQGDLAAIKGAAEHGSELTRKLLAFSRHQRLQMRSVAVEPLVKEFVRLTRRMVPEDVEVELAAVPEGATVVGDPAALEQILMNLVTNSRDAMPSGGRLRIEVALAELDAEDCRIHGQGAPGAYVVLSVHDNGAGMDAETQRRMFEPFFTTKPVGKGTGLGMPIVYGLVKEHHGFVRTYSEEGAGTTVRIYLPAAAAGVAQEVAAGGEARGGAETILLVEDDEALRRSGMRVLTRYGYTVITACDGREALDIIRSATTAPDLIVSDVVMPHGSGPELLRALREAGIQAKVLFTSGYPARDVHERMPLEPGVPFLAKPWTIHDLVRRVREVLDTPAAT